MTSRWALFVDAGWLFAAGSMSAFGERLSRVSIGWEPSVLIEALVAEGSTLVPLGAHVLRVYWYDGAPNRLPIGDQLVVAELEDVKLRLGRTGRNGQKGVDGLIIHDLITLSARSVITDAVVMSGDEDLLEAIESAQAAGTRVHLLEIPIGGIARSMLRAFDRRRPLDEAFWLQHLRKNESEGVEVALGEAADLPTNIERQSPSAFEAPAPVSSLPPLHRPAWMDTPLRPVLPPTDLVESDTSSFGESFARRWIGESNGRAHAELLAARPYLPAEIDSRLLRHASEPLLRRLTEGERKVLRDAFWSTLSSISIEPEG